MTIKGWNTVHCVDQATACHLVQALITKGFEVQATPTSGDYVVQYRDPVQRPARLLGLVKRSNML